VLLPGASLAAAAGARAAASGGSWGKAEEARGLAARNKGGFAVVTSVSCDPAGNCSAVGTYANRSGHERSYAEAFVVSQKHGRWGKAEEIPGTAALNVGDYADFSSVSCGSAGNCAAAGNYAGRSGNSEVFVVSQKHGRWGKAEEAPGLAAMNKGDAEIESVSCAPAGSCTAGGTYAGRSGNSEAFVVSRKNGTWGKAEQVPGSAALNTGGDAEVSSVSCASAGRCAAGGQYSLPGNQNGQPSEAFVVSQKKGRWGKAERVPGLAALDTGRQSEIDSVSCDPAGSCTAAGFYTGRSASSSAFVVSQHNGTWGKAEEVPGTAALSKDGGFAAVNSVSCPSAGNCSAVGHYAISVDGGVSYRAFVVSQHNGTWGKAEQVPGLAALDTGDYSALGSVSCGSAGNCSAGGTYAHRRPGNSQAFVVTQHNGTWGKAEQVPGTAALNKGDNAEIGPVSCAPTGSCSAGGYYTDSSRHQQAFLVSQAR
jgi:cytochrome c551/c552